MDAPLGPLDDPEAGGIKLESVVVFTMSLDAVGLKCEALSKDHNMQSPSGAEEMRHGEGL